MEPRTTTPNASKAGKKKLAAAATLALFGGLLLGANSRRAGAVQSDDARDFRLLRSAENVDGDDGRGGGTSNDSNNEGDDGKDFFADAEWCLPPNSPPLQYDDCPNKSKLYKYGVYGGLTNALGFILKGAIHAYEDGVCFTVDQTGPIKYAPMAERDEPEKNVPNFLGRYFEPIGLPWGGESSGVGVERHPLTRIEGREFYGYPQINEREYKRLAEAQRNNDGKRSIRRIGIQEVDNVTLKKGMVRRMWRLLPDRRDSACSRLSSHGIRDKYLAMSVRRGDKKIEFEGMSEKITMQLYVDQAEKAIETHFGWRVPTIFVATDDCSALGELRDIRPQWTFVSECDREADGADDGFVLGDMKHWTLEQTDAHYDKFFAELIGMAEAEYWIGVSFTNVSMWVYFMRNYWKGDDSWVFVDNLKATVMFQ